MINMITYITSGTITTPGMSQNKIVWIFANGSGKRSIGHVLRPVNGAVENQNLGSFLYARSTETWTILHVEAIAVFLMALSIASFVIRMILMDVQVFNCIMECFI